MVEELLAHIPFHVRAHHVSLITYVVFAQALDDIHGQKPGSEPGESPQDDGAVFCEKRVCHGAEDLRVGKIHNTDKCGADQVNKKDRFIRRIITDKFSECVDESLLSKMTTTILAHDFLLDKEQEPVIR